MSDSFDPYLKWLGIAAQDQPPNHYRLLGIDLFQEDADVIENAVDQRMAHVRTFQSGQHSKLSQQILNEISAAKLVLLISEKKAAYDHQLKAQLAAHANHGSPAQTAKPVTPVVPQIRPQQPLSKLPRHRSVPMIPVAIGAGALVLIVVIVALAMMGGAPSNDDKSKAVSSTQGNSDGAPTTRTASTNTEKEKRSNATWQYWNSLNATYRKDNSFRNNLRKPTNQQQASRNLHLVAELHFELADELADLPVLNVDREALELGRQAMTVYRNSAQLHRQMRMQVIGAKGDDVEARRQKFAEQDAEINRLIAELNNEGTRLRIEFTQRYGRAFPRLE